MKIELSEFKNGEKVLIVYIKGVNGSDIDAKNDSFVFMNGVLEHKDDVVQDENGNWITDFTGNCVAHGYSKKYSHFERVSN